MLSVLRPFPSPLLSRHGIDLDFRCWRVAWRCSASAW